MLIVVQVECHPRLPQHELRTACQRLDIVVTAYSPFGAEGATCKSLRSMTCAENQMSSATPDTESARNAGAPLLRHKTVLGVAQAVNKTPTQACMGMLQQVLAMCCLSAISQTLLSRLRHLVFCRFSCNGRCR